MRTRAPRGHSRGVKLTREVEAIARMWACYGGPLAQVNDIAWGPGSATNVIALRGGAAQLTRSGEIWTATGATGAVVGARGQRTPWWPEPECQGYHGLTWLRWTRTAVVAGIWAAVWREGWGLQLDLWKSPRSSVRAGELREGERLEVAMQACPRERAQRVAGYVAEVCTERGQTSVALSDVEWSE